MALKQLHYLIISIAMAVATGTVYAAGQPKEHQHNHQVSAEQFAELREKVPLYRELTDEQVLENMQRMGPNFYRLLSEPGVTGDIGILALGHGYRADGNVKFAKAYAGIAASKPTAMALGMAMMTSQHIQGAVDELTAAGAKKIVVMPITTLRDGGLTGQWQYIFDAREEAPWMSVSRVSADASTVLTDTPGSGPEISAILLDNLRTSSSDPQQEVVAVVAHGPDNDPANKKELAILAEHAQYIQANGGFADARGFTLQDDAPSAVRSANVAELRRWVQAASDEGKTVIVTTTLLFEGSVHDKLRSDLAGLNYRLNTMGVLDNPLFLDWINAQIAAAN